MPVLAIFGIVYLIVAAFALWFLLALFRGAGRHLGEDDAPEADDFDRSMHRWRHLREGRK